MPDDEAARSGHIVAASALLAATTPTAGFQPSVTATAVLEDAPASSHHNHVSEQRQLGRESETVQEYAPNSGKGSPT